MIRSSLSSALLFAIACNGSGGEAPTERLWVSAVPTSTKQELSAFVTTRTGADKYLGAFFHGSVLRGHHDVFEWRDEGKQAATLRFLQDGTVTRVHYERCTPTRGFDDCILLHGDPNGATRYQSRKRWVVRRPGKRSLGEMMVPQLLAELAGEDAELESLLVLDADAL